MTDVPALSELTGNTAFAHSRNPQKRAFLRLYAETGNIGKAFDTIGMHRSNHFHWLRHEAYAEAFKTAQLMAGNKFEDEVYRRAFSGIDKPLVYQGQISKDENGNPVTVKEYSDLLAIFALKGLFSDKYRDNQAGVTLTGTDANQYHRERRWR
jgi:hypothetical protein